MTYLRSLQKSNVKMANTVRFVCSDSPVFREGNAHGMQEMMMVGMMR